MRSGSVRSGNVRVQFGGMCDDVIIEKKCVCVQCTTMKYS